jgi:hypothetical protein
MVGTIMVETIMVGTIMVRTIMVGTIKVGTIMVGTIRPSSQTRLHGLYRAAEYSKS